MEPIFRYKSYRDFLGAAYENARKNQTQLSLERYSKKIGLGSSNFKMILSGDRNLTSHHCLQIARALRMSPTEIEYFEALVHHEQAKTSWEKALYSRRLKKTRKELRLQSVRISSRTFLNESVAPALLVYLSDVMKPGMTIRDLDHEKLAKMFKCTSTKVNELLDKFDQEGLIKTNEEGKLHFVFDKLTNTISQKAYLKRVMSEAAEKIESEYERSESYFTAFTFSTSNENLQALRLDLKELMDKHMSRVDASTPSARIAQACFQVFPISEITA